MKLCISILAVAAFVASPVVADQVIASPGMTLTEAAQIKFNNDTRPDDRHVTPVPGNAEPSAQLYRAAGLTPEEAQGWTLDQLFVAKINRESDRDEQQLPPTSVSRAYGMGGDYSALARSAGLTPEEAANMSFDEIANAKLNRDH
jgi:hypothetical protein